MTFLERRRLWSNRSQLSVLSSQKTIAEARSRRFDFSPRGRSLASRFVMVPSKFD